jgi:DNA mismatch endonuclease (patch repair protein)
MDNVASISRVMGDFLSKVERSVRMSAIRGRRNKTTELKLASLLRQSHISGWRRHLPLSGRPDFAFVESKLAIFVDGCFWHGCPKHSTHAARSGLFWRKKLAANIKRDRKVNHLLRSTGWRVLRIWEHQLQDGEAVINRIQAALSCRHTQYPMISTSFKGNSNRRLLKTASMNAQARAKSSLPR